MNLTALLCKEFNLRPAQVDSTLALLDDASTVPFIARYRKEATGGLDEVQIRDLRDRAQYLREMEERRQTILVSIKEQDKLTPDLEAKILAADTKQALEDLYLPYKPKRRTRAAIAREKGLEPLARLIFEECRPDAELNAQVAQFVAEYAGEITPDEVWAGCRDIYAELVAEDAEVRAHLRSLAFSRGELVATATKAFAEQTTKFSDYYNFREALAKIPPHRYLAVNRGEKEDVLRLRMELEEPLVMGFLGGRFGLSARGRALAEWHLVLGDAWQRLLAPAVEVDVRMALKEAADTSSIGMFSQNMKNLLLSPPGGQQVVLGLDPGVRTGTKWVVVDATGRLLEHGTVYPLQPRNDVEGSARVLSQAITRHDVSVIAVGNGTAGREMLAFAKAMVQAAKLKAQVVMVNESGASVYSASDAAREEFPDLDVTIRGAVSIARRWQDPLAELVKIDPKSIGVGQYQHDVNQTKLKQSLDETVESCVNHVGVNLNQASAALLRYVSGIGPSLAKSIVRHRDAHGPFPSRKALEQVAGLGPKAFQQCAGFLRIPGAAQPLDNSAVHPERYRVVERMAQDLSVSLAEMIANETLLAKIPLERYVEGDVGLPTLRDMITEMKKPGRDPRSDLKPVEFAEGVNDMADLQPGMELNGVVTNITHFGAFVDIGVHQDGLVHVSEMADTFVKDPAAFLKVGQAVRVKVVQVDAARKRIGLSLRQNPGLGDGTTGGSSAPGPRKGKSPDKSQPTTYTTKPQPATLPASGNINDMLAALNNKLRS